MVRPLLGIGLLVMATSVSQAALISDSFTLTSTRLVNTSIYGQKTEEGEATWLSQGVTLGGDATNGYVKFSAANSSLSVALPANVGPVIRIEADLHSAIPAGGNAGWIGVGMGSGNQSTPQVWNGFTLVLMDTGFAQLLANGTGKYINLGIGTGGSMAAGEARRAVLEYNTINKTLSAWIGSVQVANAYDLKTIGASGFTPAITYVGISTSNEAGTGYADNFVVVPEPASAAVLGISAVLLRRR